MNRADVLRMAREAGFEICVAGVGVPQMRLAGGPVDAPWLRDALDRFAALVAAEANAARIAAQTENEALKARLAASGVAERRAVHEAVLAEREACAKVCHDEGVYQLSQQGNAIMADKCWFMRDEIRARANFAKVES